MRNGTGTEGCGARAGRAAGHRVGWPVPLIMLQVFHTKNAAYADFCKYGFCSIICIVYNMGVKKPIGYTGARLRPWPVGFPSSTRTPPAALLSSPYVLRTTLGYAWTSR